VADEGGSTDTDATVDQSGGEEAPVEDSPAEPEGATTNDSAGEVAP
jgi:hypothetical protein